MGAPRMQRFSSRVQFRASGDQPRLVSCNASKIDEASTTVRGRSFCLVVIVSCHHVRGERSEPGGTPGVLMPPPPTNGLQGSSRLARYAAGG
jgi:hypothetical protein